MGAAAANGQGASNEVAHTTLQGFLLRAVVDGQGDAQLGDIDIAHGSGAGKV